MSLLNKSVRREDETMKNSKLACAVEAEVKYETSPPPPEVVGSRERSRTAGLRRGNERDGPAMAEI